MALCKAMLATGIAPDFITVDGGEGGTGAAPVEYSNSVGMPLMDAIAFVSDCLTGFDLKRQVKVIASGKIFTGFHLVKRLSLGADLCNSGRGMMLAMGCIQSLQCNKDTCPTGISTHNPALVKGLVVADKVNRVANFHRQTLKNVAEIMAAAGLLSPQELNRAHIFRRVSQTDMKSYEEIYPSLQPGCFLNDAVPAAYANDLRLATKSRRL